MFTLDNSQSFLQFMDIALQQISTATRRRPYQQDQNQRQPQMNAPRGQYQGNGQNYQGMQYQQNANQRQYNPRPNNSPNQHTYQQQNNNRPQNPRSNYREEPPQQQYNDYVPPVQREYQAPHKTNNPRFPPPPPREYRGGQNRQQHSQDRNQPQQQNYRHQSSNNYQQRNYEPQQPRYEKRPQRDQGGYNRRNEEGYAPRQNNYQNNKYRGNNNAQNQAPRQEYRQNNYAQRQEQFDPSERGRGRGRGRGREISHAINQRSANSQRDVGRPQPKVQPPARKVSEEEKMESAEQYESESQSEQSKQSNAISVQNQSEEASDNDGAQQNSQEEADDEQRSPLQSDENMPVLAREPQSSNSLNMQQIDSMCAKEEFNERLDTFKTNNNSLEEGVMRLDTGRSFAIFEINKKTYRPDQALTLKRYRRSTNRAEGKKQQDEKDMPRSKIGLMQAIRHIHKEIIDADNVKEKDLAFPFPPGENRIQFLHIFDFLWNRMREMIKDVSRLDMKDRSSAQIVTMCEQMLRFFVIACREGKLPHHCRLEFDPKLNLESITKILTQLMEIYEESHMKLQKDKGGNAFISPNQPEIIGYAIIISMDIQRTLNEKLMVRLNGQGLNHPLVSSKEIQIALKIKKALKNRDYQTYFQILEDENTDYVMSCLLMHHLPIVRREALRTIYRSSETQAHSKAKKTPQSFFRQALRFKEKQNREFREFLAQINASIVVQNGESFVMMGQLQDHFQDDQLASSYLLDTNKTLRGRFNLEPCSKRLKNTDQMSREELIKRSWYAGNYEQMTRKYYRNEEVEGQEEHRAPIAPQPVSKKINKEAVIPHEVQAEIVPAPNPQVQVQKINFLTLKKKEFQRQKFIKNLQALIQNLIKNSDIHSQHQRKKGLQTILQLTDLSRLLMLQSAFTRIAEHVRDKIMAEKAIKELKRYKQIKEEFQRSFNRNAFQFPAKSKPEKSKMSELLKLKKKANQSSILKQIFSIYKQSATSGMRRFRVLYIFGTDPRKNLTDTQLAFLSNFYNYVTLKDSKHQDIGQQQIRKIIDTADSELKFEKRMFIQEDNTRLEIDYQAVFFNLRLANGQDIPFLSGFDGIVFIDLWKSITPFHSLLKEMHQNKRSISTKAGQQAKTSLALELLVLHAGSSQGSWQASNLSDYHKSTESLKKDFQWQSVWQRTERQALKISPTLKLAMMNFFTTIINKPEPESLDLAVYSLSNLIDQIQRNLECLSAQELKKQVNDIQFLQLYFNESLQCIRRSLTKLIPFYQSFDWKEILQQAIYLRPGPKNYLTFDVPSQIFCHQERVNFNHQLCKKFNVALELLSSLKLNISTNFSQLSKSQSQNNGLYLLSSIVETYMQNLSKQNMEEYFCCLVGYVVQTNCRLNMQSQTITGDCKSLFLFVLSQIKIKLKYLNIILPRGFQFKIPKEALTNDRKKPPQSLEIIAKTSNPQKKRLNYLHSSLLSRLLHEIQQQASEDQPVQPCKKYIKIC